MKTIRILTAILLTTTLVRAAEEDPTAKFREALKNTMLKLRDAQNQLAGAQAAQYAAETKAQEFEEKSKALAKELAEERNTSTTLISGLKKDLTERDATIAEQAATLAKWKKSYDEIGKLAVKREMQRRHLFRQWSRLAAALAWQQLFAKPAQAQVELPPWTTSANVFSLGVASGEPRHDSVVLWTRLAPVPSMVDGGMPVL